MKKHEIADYLGITWEEITNWAQEFDEWFDPCAWLGGKDHSDDDLIIFRGISQINEKLDKNLSYHQRIQTIRNTLWQSPLAINIKQKRHLEKDEPTSRRWQIIGHECNKYNFEWLAPLRPKIDSIVSFGCWTASANTGTCVEPYTLLWVLEASRILTIDINSAFIDNAKQWLAFTRQQYPYFKDYSLEFVVGDLADKHLIQGINELEVSATDLSFCWNVLYNIEDMDGLQTAIENMAKVVKPGGWVIAVEPKMGVSYDETQLNEVSSDKCFLDNLAAFISVPISDATDISKYFENLGLRKFDLEDAPEYTYCYQKRE